MNFYCIFSQRVTIISTVCGRVLAVGNGLPDGFYRHQGNLSNIDRNYLDRVSITHGPAGSPHHIWSFAMGHTHRCPCDHNHSSFDQPLPPTEVNENYFCSEVPERNATELWQGKGCSTDDPCCSYSDPPFFNTYLPAITNESIEIRICSDEHSHDEHLSLIPIELYIQLINSYKLQPKQQNCTVQILIFQLFYIICH